MTEQNDTPIDDPQAYGIQDPQHPGEPDYFSHPVSEPVPGTRKETRDEQAGTRNRRHDVPKEEEASMPERQRP